MALQCDSVFCDDDGEYRCSKQSEHDGAHLWDEKIQVEPDNPVIYILLNRVSPDFISDLSDKLKRHYGQRVRVTVERVALPGVRSLPRRQEEEPV